jgi:succinate-semialdehyde dehydrogenase / glutarate-semialdehyde dehydrogenase
MSSFDRPKLMFKVANLFCDRVDAIASPLALQQGNLLHEPEGEMLAGTDMVGWFNEDARPACESVIPTWTDCLDRPVVNFSASFVVVLTLWNFSIHHAARTLLSALGAGCATAVRLPGDARRRVWHRVPTVGQGAQS